MEGQRREYEEGLRRFLRQVKIFLDQGEGCASRIGVDGRGDGRGEGEGSGGGGGGWGCCFFRACVSPVFVSFALRLLCLRLRWSSDITDGEGQATATDRILQLVSVYAS